VSALGGTSLQAIADETDGAYLSAESSPIPLEEIYSKRISRLEGRELFAGKERIPHDRYQWPLVLAATCMLAEAALRERRPRDREASIVAPATSISARARETDADARDRTGSASNRGAA
jgi:hypothetical protein